MKSFNRFLALCAPSLPHSHLHSLSLPAGAPDRDGRWIDKENFALLVEETYAAFKPHGWLLSAAVTPAEFRVDAGYHVRRLSDKLDFINVMTYDLRGLWTKAADHHSPLHRRDTDSLEMMKLNTVSGPAA